MKKIFLFLFALGSIFLDPVSVDAQHGRFGVVASSIQSAAPITYATWDPANKYLITLSGGNLDALKEAGGNSLVKSTIGTSTTGYYECLLNTCSDVTSLGFCTASVSTTDHPGREPGSHGLWSNSFIFSDGGYISDNPSWAFTVGDRMSVAINVPAGWIKWYKNGSLLYTLTGLPAGTYFACFGGQDNSPLASSTTNFGESSLTYGSIPTGLGINPGLY